MVAESTGEIVTYSDIMKLGWQVPATAEEYPTSSQALAIRPEEGRELTALTEILYKGLGQLAQASFEDEVVGQVLSRHAEMSNWRYYHRTGAKLGYLSVLDRDIRDLDGTPPLPDGSRRRRVLTTGSSLLLIMEQIAACDIRDILNFERQIEAPSIILTPSSEEMSRLAQTFTSHWGHNRINDRKENPEDHFTVLETTVLGLMTHCDTYDDMAMLLGASGSTLSRMLSRVAEEYGAQTQVDLMLVGISAGAASVAHVPAGRTEGISSRHLSFLQRYFSNDPMERNSARSIPTSTIGSNFKRAADSIGVKGAKELVKCLVRDGRIDLPIMPQSRFDIDRETTTPRTTLASGRLLVMHTERYIRQDGRIKILPEIPFNILSLLAKHADKVVGMPEMRNHVWPDEAIDHRNPQGRQYNQVATGLSQLRGALDRTDLGHPRTGVIRNIYGEGWMAQSQLP